MIFLTRQVITFYYKHFIFCHTMFVYEIYMAFHVNYKKVKVKSKHRESGFE